MLNPRGFAGADFLVDLLPDSGLFRVCNEIKNDPAPPKEYLEGIEVGIAMYYEEQSVNCEFKVPLPAAIFTVTQLYSLAGHTEARHVKLVGCFAASQLHKQINQAEQDGGGNSASLPCLTLNVRQKDEH